MRCAVFNCNENNNKGKSNVRFYCFPKDTILRKQWIHFCKRKDNLNPNTARICSTHFTPENIERNLQFEMGLCKNNEFKLKVGTVPTIHPQTTAIPSSRDIRMQSKAKKEMFSTIMADKPVLDDEPEAIANESIPDSVNESNQTIALLKEEIEDLKKEKCFIQEMEKTYLKQILSLQKKLQKSEFERINMEKR